MNASVSTTWLDANQRHLSAAVGVVKAHLEAHAAQGKCADSVATATARLQAAAGALPGPSALETLCALFGLSPFERDLLLLCAGVELDADCAALCCGTGPNFGLALAALPEAHWSALNPGAPLRRWRLLELGAGSALVNSPLRIDERVLHYLTGVHHLDEHLVGFVQPVAADAGLVPSQQALAERIAAVWAHAQDAVPAVQLCGGDPASRQAIAAAAADRIGLRLYALPADLLPGTPHELDVLIRLWEREAALGNAALLLDCEATDTADAARRGSVDRFIDGVAGVLLTAGAEQHRARRRSLVGFEIARPTRREQYDLWEGALGAHAAGLNGQISRLVDQFDLHPVAIRAVCSQTLEPADSPQGMAVRLWHGCRAQARPGLDALASRIEPLATRDDLVLPERQRRTLRDIAVHVRQRTRVYESWGFAAKSSRGLGISALFAGASGTGKTLAAEVLARELELDLYRIDLSQVVSKYIGETEKNLRKVFDAAEQGGAILLFDEADALFGKRSEVKDSHDRYANIEVSYLLQRMEAYRGLAILTTNMKSALDEAFLRRIRFSVSFPFPDATQRAAIWRRIFPPETPTEGLDADKLARLNVAGGNIRNIALHAAFLAAEAGAPVRMAHLLQAAQVEYAKLEKLLTEAEIRGWS